MEFNADGTIKPLMLDRKGVGPLAKVDQPKPMDLSKAKATASSSRETRFLRVRILEGTSGIWEMRLY